nr:MAG TPA: YonK protein [Caudoviricetes sp.]
MKDVYSKKTTIKVIGYLTEDENRNRYIEVYENKDEPPTIVSLDALINEMVGKQISISSEEDNL